MLRNRAILLLVLLLPGLACSKTPKPFDRAAHKREIENWQRERAVDLQKEDGWLSLVGLFWLREGENKFGSDTTDPVSIPKNKAPADAGSFWLEKGRVRIEARPGTALTSDGKPVTKQDLKDDSDDHGPTVMKLDTLVITVVKRSEKLAVRVKDSQSKTRLGFKGLEYFPVDPKWRIEARWEPYQPVKKISITNVLGLSEDETSPGAIAF